MGNDSPCGDSESELDAARVVAGWAGIASSNDLRTMLAAMYWFKNFTTWPNYFEVKKSLGFADTFLEYVKEQSK